MTDHVKNQLCQRIEELEKEKLELNEQLDALQEERDALYRIALKAAATSYRRRASHIPKSGCAVCGNGGMAGCPYEARQPSTHLARLKAQWQSEELQELYSTWKSEGMMRVGALLDKAIELQEEAEGGPMTDHNIKINAMSDAHREIRRSMRALAIASTMLEDAKMPTACGELRAAYDILRSITQTLYHGIHTDNEGDSQ